MSKKKVNSLRQIENAEFEFIPAMWKGTPVLIKARVLSQVQTYACGNFSLIDLKGPAPTPFLWRKWAEFSRQKYEIVKASLQSPTYEQIFELIGKGPMVEHAEAEFKEISALIETLPRGPARQKLENHRDSLLCKFRFLLPDDFIGSIITYALAEEGSDIKKIYGDAGREMLLTAAILAENGHDNPADHIDGAFTPFMMDDINGRAWEILKEERKKNTPKAAKNGN